MFSWSLRLVDMATELDSSARLTEILLDYDILGQFGLVSGKFPLTYVSKTARIKPSLSSSVHQSLRELLERTPFFSSASGLVPQVAFDINFGSILVGVALLVALQAILLMAGTGRNIEVCK